MISLIQTDGNNADFRMLAQELDQLISERDGTDFEFYHQFNGIDDLQYAVVAYEGERPLACGAIKPFRTEAMEIKRMYVRAEARGKHIATQVLVALEKWAKALGRSRCVLETGTRYPEAIALYRKNHYSPIPNYDQYENVATSVCFGKDLKV